MLARSMLPIVAVVALAACSKAHGPATNDANSVIDAAPLHAGPPAMEEAPAIRVLDPRVVPATTSAAIYLTIDNDGGADRLTAIEAQHRGPVTLHQSNMSGGVMRMRAMPGGIAVAAHGQTKLAPMGLHAMIEPLEHAPHMGDQTMLTLHFERQGEVEVTAPTTSPNGAM